MPSGPVDHGFFSAPLQALRVSPGDHILAVNGVSGNWEVRSTDGGG